MAWRNQPGRHHPDQQEPAFLRKSILSFARQNALSLPDRSRPPLPKYSGTASASQPQVSPQIRVVARAARLGEPTREYRKGACGSDRKAFVAWLCPGGLIYQTNYQLYLVGWNDVKQIWRKTGMLNGTLTTLGYTVEPNSAPAFSFSMLNGSLADGALQGDTHARRSAWFGGGKISNKRGLIQISGQFSLTEYAGLGDLIEERVIQQVLPRMMESYSAGGVLSFGVFVVSQQGVSDGARELAWADIDRVQISALALQITAKPAGASCFAFSAGELPNFVLLCTLLRAIQEDRAS